MRNETVTRRADYPSPPARPALARLIALVALALASSTCAGSANDTGGAGGSDGGQSGCASPSDCPAPSNACVVATCTNGVCGTASAPTGTVVTKDSPADCYAMVCDQTGSLQKGVDPTNVPVSTEPCQMGTCDMTGAPGTTPAATGTACNSATGGKLCDGSGNCVACLDDADCPAGDTCGVLNNCMGSHCMDGVHDDDETDLDCGGSACPPCIAGRMCLVDADCASHTCDPLLHVCLGSMCMDGTKDGNETDTDCGGSCSECALNKMCMVDQDCFSKACDAVSHTCAASQCVDHMKDGSETDTDCGGGTCPLCALGQQCVLGGDCLSGSCTGNQCSTPNACINETDVGCGGGGACPPCALGQKCQIATDCLSMACDALSLLCVADHCSDHALDGDETDSDCGGPTCAERCTAGKWCKMKSDCTAGLSCAGSPAICE